MTPPDAASLIREAARGWTSAELAQFYSEVKNLFEAQMDSDLEDQYKLGYEDGHEVGFTEGYAQACTEDSTDN